MFKELGKISDFTLIAGDKSPYNNMVMNSDFEGYDFCFLKNKFLLKGRHRLTFQFPNKKVIKLILKSKDAHFVFLGVDPHIISSIFYSLILKIFGYKVSWWGHGTLGKGIIKAIRIYLYKQSYRILVYGNDAEVLSNLKLKNKVRVIGNTMNWEDYADSFSNHNYKLPIIKDEIKILFSGRIVPNKKIDILLEACSKLKIKYKLVVIGDGDEVNQYKKYVKSNFLNVEFVGAQYGEKVKEIMSWANVMIIPGKVGLSLVHAYGNGLPVVIHDSFELHSPEHEIHTKNKDFLFKIDDSKDLANKITKIFNNDLINKEINNCRESIEKNGYFPDIVASKFLSSLNKI